MKSKALKVIIIIIAVIIALVIVDNVLENYYVYNFFGSIMLGFLCGGLFAISILWVGGIALSFNVNNERRTKKIERITQFSIWAAPIISCVVMFLVFGDFVQKISYDTLCSSFGCDNQAVYCTHQNEYNAYCEYHKDDLLWNMEQYYAPKSDSSSGGGNYNNKDDWDWDDYDDDNDGNINQGEWENALGDYMDDIMR